MELVLVFFNDPGQLCHLHTDSPQLISYPPRVGVITAVVGTLVELTSDVRVYFGFF